MRIACLLTNGRVPDASGQLNDRLSEKALWQAFKSIDFIALKRAMDEASQVDEARQMDVDAMSSFGKGKGKARGVESNEPHENETLPWLGFPPLPSPSAFCSLT